MRWKMTWKVEAIVATMYMWAILWNLGGISNKILQIHIIYILDHSIIYHWYRTHFPHIHYYTFPYILHYPTIASRSYTLNSCSNSTHNNFHNVTSISHMSCTIDMSCILQDIFPHIHFDINKSFICRQNIFLFHLEILSIYHTFGCYNYPLMLGKCMWRSYFMPIRYQDMCFGIIQLQHLMSLLGWIDSWGQKMLKMGHCVNGSSRYLCWCWIAEMICLVWREVIFSRQRIFLFSWAVMIRNFMGLRYECCSYYSRIILRRHLGRSKKCLQDRMLIQVLLWLHRGWIKIARECFHLKMILAR